MPTRADWQPYTDAFVRAIQAVAPGLGIYVEVSEGDGAICWRVRTQAFGGGGLLVSEHHTALDNVTVLRPAVQAQLGTARGTTGTPAIRVRLVADALRAHTDPAAALAANTAANRAAAQAQMFETACQWRANGWEWPADWALHAAREGGYVLPDPLPADVAAWRERYAAEVLHG